MGIGKRTGIIRWKIKRGIFMKIILQLAGVGGGIFGIVNFFQGNDRYWIIGLIIVLLLCDVSKLEWGDFFMIRIFPPAFYGSIGMVISHFLFKLAWGRAFLISATWVLLVVAVFGAVRAIVAAIDDISIGR
jgi:hypothetical protein